MFGLVRKSTSGCRKFGTLRAQPCTTSQLEKGYMLSLHRLLHKIKQESSVTPAHAQSDAEKERYIDDYFEQEGINLDPFIICKKSRFVRFC